MHCRDEGCVRIIGKRIAQRQRAVCSQLGDEPVGDRPHALVLFGLRRGIRRGVVVGGDARGGAGPGLLGIAIARAFVRRRERRLVFGPEIAAFDSQGPRAVDADEGPGAGDLGWVEDDGPLLESGQRRLDLGKPLVDLLRNLIRLGVSLFQLVELGPEGVVSSHLFLRQRTLLPDKAAQIVGVAIREVGRDLNPPPAFGANRVGFALELIRDQPVEQGWILQPAAVIRIEEIAQDGPARSLVSFDPDELGPLVRGAHRAFRQHATDLVGLLGIGALQRLPHLLLTRMVGIDGERHDLVQGHAVLGIDIEQLGRDGSKAQPLARRGR